MSRDILMGVVIGAQGLRGDVRVKTFAAAPGRLHAYGSLHTNDGRRFEIADMRAIRDDVVSVRFKNVESRRAAESLKGTELYVSRAALPATDANEFYHVDLIGLRAEDSEGRLIGEVRAIHNFGAGDVIEIARGDGDTVLLPFTRESVPAIDLDARRIVISEPVDDSAIEKRGIE